MNIRGHFSREKFLRWYGGKAAEKFVWPLLCVGAAVCEDRSRGCGVMYDREGNSWDSSTAWEE